jgi:SSS family solute:Na+ symporter
MNWLDASIIIAFVVYALSSGFRNRKQASQNLEEYFLAGRSLPGWKAGLSMSATQFAADTPLLVTGVIALSGIFGLWQMWVYGLSFLMMGFLLSESWRRVGVITDAELTEVRYGAKPAAVLRIIKAFYFGTIFNCTVLAWVFFAAAKIAEPFLPWHDWLPRWFLQPFVDLVTAVGIPLSLLPPGDPNVWIHSASNLFSIIAILVITTFYSTTGGLRSVVATDVGQIGLMLLGTLLYAFFAVSHAGGLGAITDKLHTMFASGGPGGITPSQIIAFTPDHAKDASISILALYALQWLIQLNSDGTGYLAQRSMACSSPRESKKAAVVFTFTQILVRSLLWLPLGTALLVIFPPDLSMSGELLQADREGTFVRGMSMLLPMGVKGLMVTGMLAALASTVDTHINWGSSYWTNDIFKRFVFQAMLGREPSGNLLVWVARGSNLLIILIALVIMTQLTSINQAWQTSLLLGAGMGVVLVLRWLWWRMNAWAEIAAIAVSVVAAPLLLIHVDDTATRLLAIAIISTVAALIAIVVAGPEDKERLKDFYKRARPPGFWGPIAKACGEKDDDGRKELSRSLGAVFASGLSVFSLLTGIGSWLVGSPAPAIFPWKIPWYLLTIIGGLALTPVWLKLGFDRTNYRGCPPQG